MNRFQNCKSLCDLYNIFATEDGVQEYSNLSNEELDRIAIVFEANIPDKVAMPDVPLTEAGYNYIWNVVVEEVETMPESEDMAETNNILKEDVVMTNQEIFKEMMEEGANPSKAQKVKATIGNAIHNMKNAAKSARVHAGDDKEDFVNRCDSAINEIKDAMGPVLFVLDEALGCSALKEEICTIMYDTLGDTKTKSGFFKMAEKCRASISRTIKLISLVDPDDKLGKIAALRVLIEEDEEGNKIYETQTIWAAFAKTICWICKKVSRKLKAWFGVDAESNVFGSVGASIAQVFARIGNVVKNAAKIAGTVLSYAVSYTVAGIIKISSLIITAIKFVVSKIKGWAEKAKTKFTKEEEFEFEVEFDEDCPDIELV